MVRIVEVIPREDYLLEVVLDTGSRVLLNMKGRLGTVRFEMLADRAFFKKAATNGSFVLWEDKIEISVSEVFQLAQK